MTKVNKFTQIGLLLAGIAGLTSCGFMGPSQDDIDTSLMLISIKALENGDDYVPSEKQYRELGEEFVCPQFEATPNYETLTGVVKRIEQDYGLSADTAQIVMIRASDDWCPGKFDEILDNTEKEQQQ